MKGSTDRRKESADKPGSVEGSHSSRTRVTARLKRPTRGRARAARCGRGRESPYLVLLRVGFTLPLVLPPARCALTAPFHPYLPSQRWDRRYVFCGTFRGLTPPRHYLAPCPMEPGLSSLSHLEKSGCLADSQPIIIPECQRLCLRFCRAVSNSRSTRVQAVVTEIHRRRTTPGAERMAILAALLVEAAGGNPGEETVTPSKETEKAEGSAPYLTETVLPIIRLAATIQRIRSSSVIRSDAMSADRIERRIRMR